MKKENKMQVSVTCLLLVIALFIIAMMAYYIYNMRDEKKIAEHETQNLNAKVNDLQTKIVIWKQRKELPITRIQLIKRIITISLQLKIQA